MILLRATKTLAIFLTLVDAVLWTYQGHRVVGLLMLAVAVLAMRFLPEE
jgi:hypothetical protein